MSELKLTISEAEAKKLRDALEGHLGPSKWQIIARAILELADKATQVNTDGPITLDPETERALRRIAEDDT